MSKPKTWTSWKQWRGRKGRVDAENVEWFIQNHPPIAQDTEYYICGPGKMNIAVRNTLLGLGVPKDFVNVEQFGGNVEEMKSDITSFENAKLTATLNEKKYDLIVPKNQTILQTLKNADANPPFSCESGVCGTCVAIVKSGKVEMKSCMALEEEDLEKGLVLTCQSLVLSDKVELYFD